MEIIFRSLLGILSKIDATVDQCRSIPSTEDLQPQIRDDVPIRHHNFMVTLQYLSIQH